MHLRTNSIQVPDFPEIFHKETSYRGYLMHICDLGQKCFLRKLLGGMAA